MDWFSFRFPIFIALHTWSSKIDLQLKVHASAALECYTTMTKTVEFKVVDVKVNVL